MTTYQQPPFGGNQSPQEPTNEELAAKGRPHVNWPKITTGLVVGLLIAGFIWLMTSSTQGEARTQGQQYQNEIMLLHGNAMIDANKCVEKFLDANKIANQERQSLGDTITKALSTRYLDANGRSVDASTPEGRALIAAIVKKLIPTVSTKLFETALSVALGCRDQIANAQKQLRGKITEFRNWRAVEAPALQIPVRRSFPNDDLWVDTLYGRLTGQNAEDYMFDPVLSISDKNRVDPAPEPTK